MLVSLLAIIIPQNKLRTINKLNSEQILEKQSGIAFEADTI